MKKILLIVLGLHLSLCYSQDTEESKPNWTKKGVITFLVNQSSFENWIAGGISNVSGTLGLNYDFNYQKMTGLGKINSSQILVSQKLKIKTLKSLAIC